MPFGPVPLCEVAIGRHFVRPNQPKFPGPEVRNPWYPPGDRLALAPKVSGVITLG